ncbi:MAG TPA: sortase [Patescibacteria group bacterium]|nr:sortase [Patescibacteria group bacterium]
MLAKISWERLKFYSSVSALYGLTLLFALALFRPSLLPFRKAEAEHHRYNIVNPAQVLASQPNATYGTPVRIVITETDNGLNIDLPVDVGSYDVKTDAWTLSEIHADYANVSMPPNNWRGNTLIYGHDSPKVFGYLSAIKPGTDATATVYTANNHTFIYNYDKFLTLSPNDVSVFSTTGHPTLIVQTCSGSFFQYRQMFHFNLQKVDGHAV